MLACSEQNDAEQLVSSCNKNNPVGNKTVQLGSLVRCLSPLSILGLLLLLPFARHIPERAAGVWGDGTILAEEKGWNERAVEISECIFDVDLASSSLAEAGAKISHASHQCHNQEVESGEEVPGQCSLMITEIFSIFAATASFLSSGIDHCPVLKTDDKAVCTASVSKLLASLSEVGVAGTLISEACADETLTDKGNENPPTLEPAAEAGTPVVEHEDAAGNVTERLLHEIGHVAQKDNKAEGNAECSIKAASAIIFLANAGSDIVHATRNCHKTEQGHEGASQLACAVAVQDSIGALATVANTLATVAMDCAQSVNIRKRCALDVTKLITALVEVATSATGVHIECVAKSHEAGNHSGEHSGQPSGEVGHRRLRN
mmetsp:Transcript_114575/g.222468  ORF Transcript_114575/g.222468 Transcript_114575/m.222468 type:complete len:376 (+) Transcript_114575:108-1235(+)